MIFEWYSKLEFECLWDNVADVEVDLDLDSIDMHRHKRCTSLSLHTWSNQKTHPECGKTNHFTCFQWKISHFPSIQETEFYLCWSCIYARKQWVHRLYPLLPIIHKVTLATHHPIPCKKPIIKSTSNQSSITQPFNALKAKNKNM